MDAGAISAHVRATKKERATAATAFLHALAEAGVTAAFGIPGGTVSPLFDGLAAVPAIRYVATRHEAGGAFAALGHARMTSIPALVLATSGPGVTNAITAIAAAYAEQVPMIVVGGEVPLSAHGRGAIQDGTSLGLRLLEMLRPITRWCGSLPAARSASSVATRAVLESSGRLPGPVFVSVPLDVGSAAAPAGRIHLEPPLESGQVNLEACRIVAAELSRAKRPLLVLGAGARKATAQAVELAERSSIPVAVTAHAKGVFPERHPLYLGVLGIGQHPSVDEYLREPPDVSIVVGSGLDDLATNGWSLPLVGTVASFQIDRDVHALGRGMAFTHLVEGDASAVLAAVVASLPLDVAHPLRRSPPLSTLRPELARSDAVPLKPQRVLAELARAYPSALWCADIGEHLAFAVHYLQVDTPDDFHNFLGLGSMGSGVGAAIGLKLARPDRQVVCVCGDGGFSMMLGELITCVEQRLPIVFAVMNDGCWNMVEHGFRAVWGSVPGGLAGTLVDFAAAARAVGAIGVEISHPRDLDSSRLRELVRANLPIVLDIRIDPCESLTAATRSASIRHFCAEAS